jgi:hypothetical protein
MVVYEKLCPSSILVSGFPNNWSEEIIFRRVTFSPAKPHELKELVQIYVAVYSASLSPPHLIAMVP